MKSIQWARVALPVAAALVSHTAFAQFTLVSQTGRLEAQPGFVVELPSGQLDPVRPWVFEQDSWNPSCSPPRCQQQPFYHRVTGYTALASNDLTVSTDIYASGDAVNLLNKGELSITFDVAQSTDVFLTLGHGVSLDATGVPPSSSSYAFGRLLGDGSFESVALPTLRTGPLNKSDEAQIRLTLLAGRYVMTSRIAFNSSQYFPAGRTDEGGAVTEGGWIRVTEVPEPGALALALGGLAMGLVAGARKKRASGVQGSV